MTSSEILEKLLSKCPRPEDVDRFRNCINGIMGSANHRWDGKIAFWKFLRARVERHDELAWLVADPDFEMYVKLKAREMTSRAGHPIREGARKRPISNR